MDLNILHQVKRGCYYYSIIIIIVSLQQVKAIVKPSSYWYGSPLI